MQVTTKLSGLLRIMCMLGLYLPTLALAQKPDVIEFGIIPTLSARTILTTYQPLREYLESHFKKPVLFVTAPDFRNFIDRTQRGEYRYLITAPHFARLAQKEAGYQPLVRVKRELQAVLVVDKSAGIGAIQNLRGKVITTPDRLAIISMLGEELLRDRGLVPGRDVTMRAQVSFNSAIIALRNGESAAAITAPTALNQMPSEVRESLTVLATTKAVSHVVCLANSRVPPAEAAMMARLLTEFSKTPGGKEFFQATGFIDFIHVSDEELQALDVYVADIKRQLSTQ